MKPLAQFWPENWKRYFEPFPFNTIDPKRSYKKDVTVSVSLRK